MLLAGHYGFYIHTRARARARTLVVTAKNPFWERRGSAGFPTREMRFHVIRLDLPRCPRVDANFVYYIAASFSRKISLTKDLQISRHERVLRLFRLSFFSLSLEEWPFFSLTFFFQINRMDSKSNSPRFYLRELIWRAGSTSFYAFKRSRCLPNAARNR